MLAHCSIVLQVIDHLLHNGLDVRPMSYIGRVDHKAGPCMDNFRGTIYISEDWVVVCNDSREIGQPRQARYRPANRKAAYRVGWGWSGL